MPTNYELEGGVVFGQFYTSKQMKVVADYLEHYWLPKWAHDKGLFTRGAHKIELK
jgi:hypothetical protein